MQPEKLSFADVLDVADRVARLHDDVAVSPAFAAVYLGVSEKTLARYRQKEEGPPYTQYPVDRSRSRNQKVNYVMGDLRTWREGHKVTSTMEAAVVRGMALMATADFQSEQPFFIENRRVIRHVMLGSKRHLASLVRKNSPIAWLTWQQALMLSSTRKDIWLDWARERVIGLLPEAESIVVRFPPAAKNQCVSHVEADWPPNNEDLII